MRILVVEDDKSMLEVICTALRNDSYQIDACSTGDEGLLYASNAVYDLIILDIMLPGADGLTIVKHIRKKGLDTPILLLTAKDAVEDRVRGLDSGADDYLTKPFAISELLARVRALIRRKSGMHSEGHLKYGPITIRSDVHDGYVNEQALKLAGKEYDLLELFLRNPKRILTKDQIFDSIWGFESDSAPSVIDVYVHHLRKKLANYNCQGYIETIRGVGYMMKGIE
ncbi:response regulator transcription factor [Cytobacillus suaedae]|nr:response regulator transcription factor [Cytobacillus suaedae]